MLTLKAVLQRTHNNLQILLEREARWGGSPPLELLNQIDSHRTAIALIEQAMATTLSEAMLADLKAELRPLLLASNVEAIDLAKLALEKPRLPFEPAVVLVGGGPFLLGSSDDAPEEAPPHEVDLPPFYLGQHPVTNREYAAFIEHQTQQPVPKKAGWFVRQPPQDKLDHPVVGVSWYDALAYCDWLSAQTRRTYRLPTEAEWEKAAVWRNNAKTIYPWGNQFDPDRCNSAAAGLDDTTQVGCYSPDGDSPAGCTDMAGNVQEWTSTLWGSDLNQTNYPYPYRVDDGREDLQADARLFRVFRIYRGGAFRDEPERLRCTARGRSDPDSKLRWRGFRVAQEV